MDVGFCTQYGRRPGSLSAAAGRAGNLDPVGASHHHAARDEGAALVSGTASRRREPPWWVNDVLIAFLIGAMLVLGQWWLDNRRADVDRGLEDRRSAAAERLENLRFVRDRSSLSRESRPFGTLDLSGLPLSYLHLVGANFADSALTHAALTSTDLREANFVQADLDVADLRGADLSEATLQSTSMRDATIRGAILRHAYIADADLRGADLTYTDLSGADLLGAKLTGAELSPICYDAATTWPEGFKPPARDAELCARFKEVGDAPLRRLHQ